MQWVQSIYVDVVFVVIQQVVGVVLVAIGLVVVAVVQMTK